MNNTFIAKKKRDGFWWKHLQISTVMHGKYDFKNVCEKSTKKIKQKCVFVGKMKRTVCFFLFLAEKNVNF